MKVRINKLDKDDDFYSIRHLLEGMIVERSEEWESDLKFSQEQCDFLQKEIPNDFKYKKYFKFANEWVVFRSHNNLCSTNLDFKCKECGFEIESMVCPNCGEWN